MMALLLPAFILFFCSCKTASLPPDSSYTHYDSSLSDTIAKLREECADREQALKDTIHFREMELKLFVDSMRRQSQHIESLNQQMRILADSVRKCFLMTEKVNYIRDKDKFYCRAILEAPLYVPYNAEKVAHCKEMVQWMSYDKSRDPVIKVTYNTLYLLVEHYKEYNDQLVQIIGYTIREFDFSPNRIEEKKKFEERINGSKYYAVRHKGGNINIQIFYMEFIIEKLRTYFNDEKSFKKENFEAVRDRLLGK